MRKRARPGDRRGCGAPSSIHGKVRHEPKVNKCKANLPVHAGGREDTPTTGNKAALFTKNPMSPLFPSRNILEVMKKQPAQSKSLASDLLCPVDRNEEEVVAGRKGEREGGRDGEGRGVPGKVPQLR